MKETIPLNAIKMAELTTENGTEYPEEQADTSARGAQMEKVRT